MRWGYTKATDFEKPMFFYVLTKIKSTNHVKVIHILIFVMLDTSQIVTPFNPHWSHNVAHNCDHANLNVDCCYDILQHLLLICMTTRNFSGIWYKFNAEGTVVLTEILRRDSVANVCIQLNMSLVAILKIKLI